MNVYFYEAFHTFVYILSFFSVNMQALFDPIGPTGITLTAGGCSGI